MGGDVAEPRGQVHRSAHVVVAFEEEHVAGSDAGPYVEPQARVAPTRDGEPGEVGSAAPASFRCECFRWGWSGAERTRGARSLPPSQPALSMSRLPNHPATAELPRVGRIVRHAGPRVLQATVIPTVAFLAGHAAFGLAGGLVAALTWSWGCILWRMATGRSVGGLLPIGAIGLTFRSLVALVSGSTFVYFAGPVVVMTGSGLVILASAWTSRPLIGRVVSDVVPLPDSVLDHPQTDRLMRRLSALWGLEQVACAAVNVYLLAEL